MKTIIFTSALQIMFIATIQTVSYVMTSRSYCFVLVWNLVYHPKERTQNRLFKIGAEQNMLTWETENNQGEKMLNGEFHNLYQSPSRNSVFKSMENAIEGACGTLRGDETCRHTSMQGRDMARKCKLILKRVLRKYGLWMRVG